jgi:cytochrome b
MRISHVLVWDLPTRVFHWLLVLSFFGAYLSGDADGYRTLHALLGYTAAGLVAFRLVWGVLGTRWARFSGFIFNIGKAAGYARSLLSGKPLHFTGHNPLGSWAVLGLLALIALACGTGIALYLEIGGEDAFEDLHEVLANAALALVVLHIAAAIGSSFLHRENLVRAMLTGYKQGEAREAAAGARALVALILVVAVLAFWSGAFTAPGMRANPGLIAALMKPDPADKSEERRDRPRGRDRERERR